MKKDDASLAKLFQPVLTEKGLAPDEAYVAKVTGLVKERCHFINEIWDHGFFFFVRPDKYDVDAVKPKWTPEKQAFFESWITVIDALPDFTFAPLEESFKQLATEKGIKPGELQLPFRIMLCAGKFGPPVFVIAETIGKEETIARIKLALAVFA